MTTSSSIVSGTSDTISAGQIDTGDTVLSGGTHDIAPGGAASADIILGSDTVMPGGSDDGALILGGGVQLVQGRAGGTLVGSGGTEIVASGGVASDTIISGGTLQLQAGGMLAGSFDFAGGGMLVISGTATPSVAISGFTATNQTIDLAGLAYASSGSAVMTAGNVLQVSENGQTVSLQFDLAQDYAGHSFALASDGLGGTALVDPRQASRSPARAPPTPTPTRRR